MIPTGLEYIAAYLKDAVDQVHIVDMELDKSRLLRTIAVGRKNYLFAGSDAGGKRAAIAYTIIGNCLMAGIDPWQYMRDVLTKLAAGWPMSRLAELLPQAWAKQQRQERDAEACSSPAPC